MVSLTFALKQKKIRVILLVARLDVPPFEFPDTLLIRWCKCGLFQYQFGTGHIRSAKLALPVALRASISIVTALCVRVTHAPDLHAKAWTTNLFPLFYWDSNRKGSRTAPTRMPPHPLTPNAVLPFWHRFKVAFSRGNSVKIKEFFKNSGFGILTFSRSHVAGIMI